MVVAPAGGSDGAAGAPSVATPAATPARFAWRAAAPEAASAGSAQLQRERRCRSDARMRGILMRDGVRLATHRGGPRLAPGPTSPAVHPADDFRALLAQLRGPPAPAASGVCLGDAVEELQQRLDALEGRLVVELTNEARSREADVYALRELISVESMTREAHFSSVQDLIASVKGEHQAHLATFDGAMTAEKDAREAHQHSMITPMPPWSSGLISWRALCKILLRSMAKLTPCTPSWPATSPRCITSI